MKIVLDNATARVAAHEELIGHGTGNYQSVPAGHVIIETGFQGVVFALPLAAFQGLVPGAVYDPDTRWFAEPDPADPPAAREKD